VVVIAALGFGGFLWGLLIGVGIGFLAGPAVRYLIAWHAWSEASAQARLTEPVMKRMGQGPWRFLREREVAGASPGRHQAEDV
jgi:hypothetical protein